MIKACSTRFIFNPVTLFLGITCMETHCLGGFLGNIPAFGQNLEGWSPFAVRRENPNHIPRMYSLYFCFLRVCVSAERGWTSEECRCPHGKVRANPRWCSSAFPKELWPGCSGWVPGWICSCLQCQVWWSAVRRKLAVLHVAEQWPTNICHDVLLAFTLPISTGNFKWQKF